MPAYAALLRGINLGGGTKVAMAELRSVCSDLGLSRVETYIQSGNVVFSSRRTDVAGLTGELESAVSGAFGFEIPVVLRSGSQLGVVAGANPFVEAGNDERALSVGFLGARPESERVRMLLSDPLASPSPGGDEFAVRGEEVFIHHPNGYGRTKLTNVFFERRLGTHMTVRNWRTVTTLVSMTSATAKGPK